MQDEVLRKKEQIKTLQSLHAGADAKQKRKITNQIKGVDKEIAALEKEIEEALEGRE